VMFVVVLVVCTATDAVELMVDSRLPQADIEKKSSTLILVDVLHLHKMGIKATVVTTETAILSS